MTVSVFEQMFPKLQTKAEVNRNVAAIVQGIDHLLLQSPKDLVKWRRSLYDDGSAQFLVQIQVPATKLEDYAGQTSHHSIQLALSPEELQKQVLAALAKDKAIPSYFVLDQEDSGIASPFDSSEDSWQIQLAFRGKGSWQKSK